MTWKEYSTKNLQVGDEEEEMSHGHKTKAKRGIQRERKMGMCRTGERNQDNRRVTEINSEKWAV